MRRRARRIRRAVAGSAAALFVAAFLGVYVQLASGHDPALDSAAKTARLQRFSDRFFNDGGGDNREDETDLVGVVAKKVIDLGGGKRRPCPVGQLTAGFERVERHSG